MESMDQPITGIVARLTDGNPDPQQVLERVAELAVASIDAVDGASVTLMAPDNKPFTTAASHDWVLQVDRLQYATLQGPCLEVAATAAPLSWSTDVAATPEWPVFGPRASSEHGVRVILSAGISGRPDPGKRDRPPGALNLYGRRDHDLDAPDREQAALLAAITGVAITLAEERANNRRLQEALTSRDVIGQAKGILMERHGISADEAFTTLRRASNQLNMKLRTVAQRVTREFPERPRGGDRDPKTNLAKLT